MTDILLQAPQAGGGPGACTWPWSQAPALPTVPVSLGQSPADGAESCSGSALQQPLHSEPASDRGWKFHVREVLFPEALGSDGQ